MKTSRPFATISYNTIPFLVNRLDYLYNKGELEFYAFIKHYAEGEVDGVPETKDHIHLFMIPSGITDTVELKDYFKEADSCNDLPLSIINCVSSKFYDWFYYSLHDEKYLASKFETRKFHYKFDDFITSDVDYLGQLLAMSDNNKLAGSERFVQLVKTGVSFGDLVSSGFIPIQLINQYRLAYDYISQSILKNGNAQNTEVTENMPDLEPVDRYDGKHNHLPFAHH